MSTSQQKISIKEAFERAGFKPLPCPKRKLTLEEEQRAREANQAVCEYLKKLHQAYEASKNSTLKFCQKTEEKSAPSDFVHQHLKMMERIKQETDESVKHFRHYARGRIITAHSRPNFPVRRFQRVKD